MSKLPPWALIFIVAATGIFVWWDRFSEAGAACRAKGGRISIEGCSRLEVIKLD